MSRTFAMKDGDWVMESNGQPKMLSDYDKANQDVVHALVHEYDPEADFGNQSATRDVQVAERAAIAGIVKRDVSDTISRLQAKQKRMSRVQLTDGERITGIKRLLVQPYELGADYYLTVTVSSLQFADIQRAFRISTEHLYPKRRSSGS